VNKSLLSATGLALAIALSPAAAHAVEILKTDDVSIDIGARMQTVGTFQNFTATDTTTGKGNRDATQIYLFERQNRLKLGANLEGVKFNMETSFANDSYANAATGVKVYMTDGTANTTTGKVTGTKATVVTSAGNSNIYNLFELNSEIPLGESTSVVAGVFRRPESVRDANSDENLLFAGESQLANLFFNNGSDLGLYAKTQLGSVDALLGVVQGTPNLPQRFIPERLSLPVPLIARIGIGNIKDDPSHTLQQNYAKSDDTQWRLGAGAFWAADSNAGHGNLFGNFAGQAEIPKGPFEQGNLMFSKSLYNPFMKNAVQESSLDRLDNQFYSLNLAGNLRIPMGDAAVVAGAEWDFSQYVTKGNYTTNSGKGQLVNGNYYHDAALTAQGGEAYLGYVASSWWAATRVDVLVPDALMGALDDNGNVASAWGNQTQWEIIFPALGYKINKFVTITAELEHNLNSTLAVDTDGVYNIKTMPAEVSLGLTTNSSTGKTTANGYG
jgi:hypothetical protein